MKLKSSFKSKFNFNYYKFFSSIKDEALSSYLPEHLYYKIPDYNKSYALDLPWLKDGAPMLEIKSRYIPDQIFGRNQSISRRDLLQHFFKIYRGVLLAASQYDYDFLNEYVEETFSSKLINKLKKIKTLEYEIEILEDLKADKNNRIIPEFHLYDSIVIKGLSSKRSSNGSIKDYSVCDDIDDMGFISYINKSVSDPGNYLTKDIGKLTLESGNFQSVIFRAYCIFKCGLKLFVKNSNGEDLIKYSNNYNFNHACIFECEMTRIDPLKSYSKVETYSEWISKHGFGVWKLVDLDNWMNGNNYFLQ